MPEMENPRPSAVCGLITLSYSGREVDSVEDPALRPGVQRGREAERHWFSIFCADPPHPTTHTHAIHKYHVRHARTTQR